MALRIRLRRMGRKNAPTYRIVVAERLAARDGRIVESIGHYNPRTEPVTLSVDRGRALHWMEHGATPTETVNSLLKKAGVYESEATGLAAAAGAVAGAASSAGAAVKEATGKAAAAAEVREKAGEFIADAREAVEDAAEEAREKAGEFIADAREAVEGAVETVRGAEEEKPAAE